MKTSSLQERAPEPWDSNISRERTEEASAPTHPAFQLQQSAGNRFVDEQTVFRAADNGSPDAGSATAAALRESGSGRPLPQSLRGSMERALGADLGGVKVHLDPRAEDAATELNANAFTVDQDIYFGKGEYNPGRPDGQRLLAHEITHTVQRGSGGSSPLLSHKDRSLIVSRPGDPAEQEAEQAAEQFVGSSSPAAAPLAGGADSVLQTAGHIRALHRQPTSGSSGPNHVQRQDDQPEKAPSNIDRLDDMLDDFDVDEPGVIALLSRLTAGEKTVVLAGTSHRNLIANALNVDEMIQAVGALNPDLATKLKWVEAAAGGASSIDYSDIRTMINSAPPGQRSGLTTVTWRDFFVEVCTNETMRQAVNDLPLNLLSKMEWIKAEGGTGYNYEEIKAFITTAAQPDKDLLKTDAWKDFFVGVCDNDTMAEAVNDLGFDLTTKLRWMIAEGTSLEHIRKAVDSAPVTEVEAVQSDPALYALVGSETGDTDVVAERLAREVLAHIQAQAALRAAAPPSVDPASNFYKALKDKYLKDYLATPSVHEGEQAVQGIGRSMETRRNPADPNIIEVKPEGGAWRPADNRWEKGAELFWNKQKVPTIPAELQDLPIFKNIKTLPPETAAATDMLIKENLTDLPYPDVPFLLGVPNTGTATLAIDVIKGGKNLSQLMHWATGVKYSKESPEAMRELFLAYEKWHLEGWDVFGQDALNDLIAEEQGRLLGAELQKGPAGAIGGEADLLPFLNNSFLKSRAWVGALLRLRKGELDQWILAKEQAPAQMHWGAMPEADIWHSPTVFQMLASGESLADVKSSALVTSQIEIYTLLYEADLWEPANGPIVLTDLEKALVAGDLDAILAWSAKGGGASGLGAASEERNKLKGGS